MNGQISKPTNTMGENDFFSFAQKCTEQKTEKLHVTVVMVIFNSLTI